MARITEQDRSLMILHLRDLSKRTINANAKHSKNIQKQIDHTIELTKIIKEDRAQIQRLNNVIDIKQREIDELDSKNMDLLWEAAQMEKELIILRLEKIHDKLYLRLPSQQRTILFYHRSSN